MDDLITRTRPTEAGIATEWTPQAQHRVRTELRSATRPRRRRWPLAVAACVLAGLMLALPLSFPGWFSRSAAAEELTGLARTTAAQPRLEWGPTQYLRVTTTSTQAGDWEPAHSPLPGRAQPPSTTSTPPTAGRGRTGP